MNQIMQQDFEHICSGVDLSPLKGKTLFFSGSTGMLPSYMIMTLLYANERFGLGLKILAAIRNRQKAERLFRFFLPNESLVFLELDICRPIDCADKIDYVIQGASPATSREFGVNPVGTIMPNVLGTFYLLELAVQNKVESFLFISSDQIYGELQLGRGIKENDYGALDPLEIRSCYAESKRSAENMCSCYHYQYHIPTKVVRPTHTFGPTLNLQSDTRVFAGFIQNVLRRENIVITGDGRGTLSFCYLADATLAFLLVLLQGDSGAAYNLTTTGNQITIQELASLLVSLYPDRHIRYEMKQRDTPQIYLVNKKLNTDSLDTTKLEALGYRPRFSIAESFMRTIDFFEQEEF